MIDIVMTYLCTDCREYFEKHLMADTDEHLCLNCAGQREMQAMMDEKDATIATQAAQLQTSYQDGWQMGYEKGQRHDFVLVNRLEDTIATQAAKITELELERVTLWHTINTQSEYVDSLEAETTKQAACIATLEAKVAAKHVAGYMALLQGTSDVTELCAELDRLRAQLAQFATPERVDALEYAVEQLSGGKKNDEESDLYAWLCELLAEMKGATDETK